jgi:hypothetical protein
VRDAKPLVAEAAGSGSLTISREPAEFDDRKF